MARKISKTVVRRNTYTFYLRDNFKPFWQKFLNAIEKDERVLKSQAKNIQGLVSIAISQLILDYLQEKGELFNETSDKIVNSEEA